MRICTGTGDDSSTGLLYGGRVSKADLLLEAYGTTDEAVAALARPGPCRGHRATDAVLRLQRELFVVGADLATNPDERLQLAPACRW